MKHDASDDNKRAACVCGHLGVSHYIFGLFSRQLEGCTDTTCACEEFTPNISRATWRSS